MRLASGNAARAGGALLLGLVLAGACALPAFGAWRERPPLGEVNAFAKGVDSVVVWSIDLPDSAAAGDRRGVELLDAAHVRQRVVVARPWARGLAQLLFARATPERACRCDLKRTADDTMGLVDAVAEFHVQDETLWAVFSFRDSCTALYLEQGPWGTLPMGPDRAVLLGSLREVLPAEAVFASDSFPPRPPDRPDRFVQVDELPEAIERPAPSYPTRARMEGVSGTVMVQALVDVDGSVADVRVMWSVPYLDAAALSAVRLWQFKPAKSHGKPVKIWVQVPVRFSLH